MTVRHKVEVSDPHAHLVRISSTFFAESGARLPDPLVLVMPVWTPGSYLVREYSRCVEDLRAGDHRVAKVRKNAWAVHHGGGTEVTVTYELYCNDLSVRTNHVDTGHLLLNGAATFTYAEHAPQQGAEVTLALPDGWSVASALPRAGLSPRVLVARDHDQLVDSPIHAGHRHTEAFEVLGKPHTFVVWGEAPAARWADVVRDTARIIEVEATLFGGLPYDAYTFFWMLSPRARGGLEHENSTTLSISPAAFEDRHGYLDTLSLVAHEFLHLWNVKRIRPAALTPYRYEEESYTRLLWWFEGATSYFDWRVLRLAGLCSVDEYLAHLAEAIVRLEDTPGRHRQSAAEASFDAWIKLYRADENTVNSTVSYYLKGELVCALLDVEIRARTAGARGLDDVLVELWRSFGKEGRPVPEDAMPGVFARVAGAPMDDVLAAWVDGRGELPFAEVFGKLGLEVAREVRARGAMGVRLRAADGKAFVASVLRARPAHKGGVEVGDEIVAIDDRRVEGGKLDEALAGRPPGATVDVTVGRDGVLRRISVTLDAPSADRIHLRLAERASSEQRNLLAAWLHGLPGR
jgi:predicted metalloprotease with PDZ domain